MDVGLEVGQPEGRRAPERREGVLRGEGSAPAASCTVKIASELPMQGSELAGSEPVVNGIKLALKQLGADSGCTFDYPDSAIYDDALNGAHDPQTGAKNMGAIAADPGSSSPIPNGSITTIPHVDGIRANVTSVGAQLHYKLTDAITLDVVMAGLVGAITWNLVTWYLGLPSSSSHA